MIFHKEPDKEYIKARNELIPEAVKYADKEAGNPPATVKAGQHNKKYEKWAHKWNLLYHSHMDKLVWERNQKRKAVIAWATENWERLIKMMEGEGK